MNCPKCGKKLADGHLYCEACGEEIKLVPEFDAEVEESMAECIRGIADEAAKTENTQKEPEEPPAKKKKSDTGFILSGGFIILLAFVLTAALFAGMAIWNHSTYIHEMVVEYYIEDGNYEKAISYMEQTVKLSGGNVAHRFKLCELYMENGQEEQALEMYKIIAGNPEYTFEEQFAAAEKIVQYYEAAENYEEIAAYLATVQDENIRLAFWQYMCVPVTFSQPEGTYASLITLKLESNGIGAIHYTTDGTLPDEKSPEFKGTIFLETGDNIISAVFINEYGVSSTVTTKKYHIDEKSVSAPEVMAYSGTYNCPVEITVAYGDFSRVYYTTDGTIPDRSSIPYTGTIYVPMGKSVYKFIAIDINGIASEVITRDFHIVLDTDMTTDDAVQVLANHFAEQGMQTDNRGHVLQDDGHMLVFEYLYPKTIEVGKDCYYFAEVSRNTETQEQQRTGKYYGVDIRTKEIYQFTE